MYKFSAILKTKLSKEWPMQTTMYVRGLRLKDALPRQGYLAQLPVVRHLQQTGELAFSAPVTFLVGENGAGKSTLLEAIAVNMGFNPEGGTINFNFATADTHSELHQYLTVIKGPITRQDGFFLRAESFYNVATNIDEIGAEHNYGGESLHCRSHGESFLALVEHRFSGHGLYLLDEPEAALSPTGIFRLMCSMDALVRQGAQFIISTHSPMLMAFPQAQVLWLDERGITPMDYRQTDHYRLTRRFLETPERMLQELFPEKS